jgi:3-oxoacyl-[acyl-carrier protein] reductase
MDIQGKAALVTGAGTGVGRATALMLAQGGCSVLVNYSRSRDEAEKVAAEIISLGGPVDYNGHLIEDSTAIALIAYLKRLGTDLFKTQEPNAPAEPPATPVAGIQ